MGLDCDNRIFDLEKETRILNRRLAFLEKRVDKNDKIEMQIINKTDHADKTHILIEFGLTVWIIILMILMANGWGCLC